MNIHIRGRSGRVAQRRRFHVGAALFAAASILIGTSVAAGAAAHPSVGGKGVLSASEVSTLKAALATASEPSHWTAGGPAFSAKGLKGKTLWLLNDATNQWADNFAAGVQTATLAAGLKFTEGSGGSNMAGDAQAIENAVNAKVSVIIDIDAPSTVVSALLKAKAAGIPVITAFNGDPHLPTAAEKADGIVADATYCYSCTGYVAAEYEILAHGGHVDSQVQQFPGNASSDEIAAGWDAGLKHYCAKTCTMSSTSLSLASNFIPTVQSGAQVAVQGGAINVLFPVYDFLMAFQLPALEAAGAQNRVDLASENADLAQMQELAAGVAVKANVGNPVAWDGWAAVDQALRAIKKLPPVKNEGVPVRLFDASNVGKVDLNANPATWYGTATFGLDYEKLWGLR